MMWSDTDTPKKILIAPPRSLTPKFWAGVLLALFLASVLLNKLCFADIHYHAHYFTLAESLLRGSLDVTDQVCELAKAPPGVLNDYSLYRGEYYVPMGPLPALLTIPLVTLGFAFSQAILLLATLAVLAAVLQGIFREFGFGRDCVFYISATLIASPILSTLVFPGPWYEASLIGLTLGLLFLYFHKIRNKKWASLLLIPLALTRPTLICYAAIPLLDILFSKPSNGASRREKLLYLLTALVIFGAIFSFYNYSRFGNPLETGYRYQIFVEEFQLARTGTNRFSTKNLVSNAIYMLFNPPRPVLDSNRRFIPPYFALSRYGIGLIFVMPWFLLYFLHRPSRKDLKYWLTVLLIATPILLWDSEGPFQIGSRFANDFFPILLIVFLGFLQRHKYLRRVYDKLLGVSVFVSFILALLACSGFILNR